MNPFKYIKWMMAIFLAVGIITLGICAKVTVNTSTFLADSVATEGSVIGQSRAPDTARQRGGVQPIVRFTGPDGPVEFTSPTASSPPSYYVGQSVPVLYRTSDPQDAVINAFFEVWGTATVTGVVGGVFTLISMGTFIYLWRRSARKRALQISGTPIVTDFQRVEIDTSFSMNGRNPFVIFTERKNPLTAQIEFFKSEALWYDPSSYLGPGKKITVLVDPAKPTNYYVDLSFLPQQNS